MKIEEKHGLYERLKNQMNNFLMSKNVEFDPKKRRTLKILATGALATAVTPRSLFAQSQPKDHWTAEQMAVYNNGFIINLDIDLPVKRQDRKFVRKWINNCFTILKNKGGFYRWKMNCPTCKQIEDYSKEDQKSVILWDKAIASIGAGIDRKNPRTWTEAKFAKWKEYITECGKQSEIDFIKLAKEQVKDIETRQMMNGRKSQSNKLYGHVLLQQLDHNQNPKPKEYVIAAITKDDKLNPLGILTDNIDAPIHPFAEAMKKVPGWVLGAYHYLRGKCYENMEKTIVTTAKRLKDDEGMLTFFGRDSIDAEGDMWNGRLFIFVKKGHKGKPVNVADNPEWRRVQENVMEKVLLDSVLPNVAITLKQGEKLGYYSVKTGSQWEPVRKEDDLYRKEEYYRTIQPHLDAERYSIYCPPELFQPSGKRSEGMESEKRISGRESVLGLASASQAGVPKTRG
ncbi:MAG: hypothetical protein ACOY3I_00040 [Verrucomicrobiota bacterium]